jgi:hypothetical protein
MKTREVEVEVLPTSADRERARVDDPFIAFASKLMDTAFVIPGTNIRFGLDPLLGLLPGLGDTVTAVVSAVLVQIECPELSTPPASCRCRASLHKR